MRLFKSVSHFVFFSGISVLYLVSCGSDDFGYPTAADTSGTLGEFEADDQKPAIESRQMKVFFPEKSDRFEKDGLSFLTTCFLAVDENHIDSLQGNLLLKDCKRVADSLIDVKFLSSTILETKSKTEKEIQKVGNIAGATAFASYAATSTLIKLRRTNIDIDLMNFYSKKGLILFAAGSAVSWLSLKNRNSSKLSQSDIMGLLGTSSSSLGYAYVYDARISKRVEKKLQKYVKKNKVSLQSR